MDEAQRPLSEHAVAELREMMTAPVAQSAVNPGVAGRLLRGALVEVVGLPSPYKVHKGGNCPHLAITPAGREALEASALHRSEG